MATPISTVTPYAGQKPAKEQEDTVFDANIDDELAYINVLPVQLNTTIGELNTFGGEMEAIASAAEADAATATAQADLAEEWATSETIVEATDYSAKEYAIGTTVESAKRHASGTVATGSAKAWATSTTIVTNGFKGARGYAQDSQTILSDVQSIAASIPVGQIDNGDVFGVDTSAWSAIRTAFETNSLPWKPIVNLDFARDNYEAYAGLSAGTTRAPLLDLATFSRASSGTGVNAFGNVETVSANQPRIVFDNGVAKGVLLENLSENLQAWSEDFSNAVWQKNNVTIGSSSVDRGFTKTKIVESATNSVHMLSNTSFTLSAGAISLQYIIASAGERDVISIGNANTGTGYSFNLSTKTVGNVQVAGWTNASSDKVIVKEISGGLFLLGFIDASSSGTNNLDKLRVFINNGSSTSYLGDGVSGIYLYAGQLEQSSTPSSYIKTEGTSVVRAPDYLIKSGVTAPDEFTLFWDGEMDFSLANPFGRVESLIGFTDGTFNNTFAIGRLSSSAGVNVVIRVGSSYVNTQAFGFSVSGRAKLIVKYSSGVMTLFRNGVKLTPVTIGDIDTSIYNTLNYSSLNTAEVNANRTVYRACAIPTALSDVVCQAITGV